MPKRAVAQLVRRSEQQHEPKSFGAAGRPGHRVSKVSRARRRAPRAERPRPLARQADHEQARRLRPCASCSGTSPMSRRATAPCVVRILDRKACGSSSSTPICTSATSTARAASQVRGDLLTLLLEAYRYTAENTAIGPLVARGRQAGAGSVRLEAQHPSPLRHRQRFLQAVARPRGAAIHLRVLRRSRA